MFPCGVRIGRHHRNSQWNNLCHTVKWRAHISIFVSFGLLAPRYYRVAIDFSLFCYKFTAFRGTMSAALRYIASVSIEIFSSSTARPHSNATHACTATIIRVQFITSQLEWLSIAALIRSRRNNYQQISAIHSPNVKWSEETRWQHRDCPI